MSILSKTFNKASSWAMNRTMGSLTTDFASNMMDNEPQKLPENSGSSFLSKALKVAAVVAIVALLIKFGPKIVAAVKSGFPKVVDATKRGFEAAKHGFKAAKQEFSKEPIKQDIPSVPKQKGIDISNTQGNDSTYKGNKPSQKADIAQKVQIAGGSLESKVPGNIKIPEMKIGKVLNGAEKIATNVVKNKVTQKQKLKMGQ